MSDRLPRTLREIYAEKAAELGFDESQQATYATRYSAQAQQQARMAAYIYEVAPETRRALPNVVVCRDDTWIVTGRAASGDLIGWPKYRPWLTADSTGAGTSITRASRV